MTGATPPPGRYKVRVKLLGQERILVPPRDDPAAAQGPAGGRQLPARQPAPGAEAVLLSDFLAAAGVLVAAAAAPPPILAARRPRARRRDAHRPRPLPDPDPRRPVAHPPDRRPAPRHRPHRRPRRRWRSRSSRPRRTCSAAGRSSCPWRSSRALPFRVPLECWRRHRKPPGPALLVIAGGVVSTLLADWNSAAARRPPHRQSPVRSASSCSAVVVVLYALQTLYSDDFSKGLQNVCFFLVPFTLAYVLLRDVNWDRRLLTLGPRRRRGRGGRLRR